MSVKAKLNYLRIAPRKVRLVADMIRRRRAEEAARLLDFSVKRSAVPIKKLLDSAIANATHNYKLDKENLFISEIKVDQGPMYKRWMPRAKGAADMIQKKTSHITLTLEDRSGKVAQSQKEESKKSESVLEETARK